MIQTQMHLDLPLQETIDKPSKDSTLDEFTKVVIASKLESSQQARGQQEGLQYNGEAAQHRVIIKYIISANVQKLKLALLERS